MFGPEKVNVGMSTPETKNMMHLCVMILLMLSMLMKQLLMNWKSIQILRLSYVFIKRDFKPSYTIKWNIWNAIKNSNSAIIVMSHSYVDSMWCRDEFEGCYVENLEDPSFRIFVIMMQQVDTLKNTDEYMKSFLASKTYLEKDDSKVFERIAEYLNWVKLPKSNDGKKCVRTKEVNDRKVPTTDIVEMFLTSM